MPISNAGVNPKILRDTKFATSAEEKVVMAKVVPKILWKLPKITR